jgi:GntR family transcriptional repressor for pyruvate dehydrogenase complex
VAHLERMGIVGQLEQEFERMIVSGMLPREDGELPSEQRLARYHGVSRASVREALRRLAARGLVVQHPGRRTRAMAVGQAVSLENLGLVFSGRGGLHPVGLPVLEGYFALKRNVTLELLTDCCARASEGELEKLRDACFTLWDMARFHWQEDGVSRWVAMEFDLLRQAAGAANRPDAYLLVQSLERAWLGIAKRMLPLLDSEVPQKWAWSALSWLRERDAQELKHELLPLLRAADERVLERLAPTPEEEDTPEAPRAVAELHSVDTAPTASEGGPGSKSPLRSDNQTGADEMKLEGAPSPESPSTNHAEPPRLSVSGASEPEHHAEVREEPAHPTGASTSGTAVHTSGPLCGRCARTVRQARARRIHRHLATPPLRDVWLVELPGPMSQPSSTASWKTGSPPCPIAEIDSCRQQQGGLHRRGVRARVSRRQHSRWS